MTLRDAKPETEYVVKNINSDDEELNGFLFTLGCYSGERVTVVSKRRSGLVLSVKDGRYNLDNELAGTIEIGEVV